MPPLTRPLRNGNRPSPSPSNGQPPPPDHNRMVVYNKLWDAVNRLDAVLDAIAAVGGVGPLTAGLTPASVEKLVGALESVWSGLDRELARLARRRRPSGLHDRTY